MQNSTGPAAVSATPVQGVVSNGAGNGAGGATVANATSSNGTTGGSRNVNTGGNEEIKKQQKIVNSADFEQKIMEKVGGAENILVALSKNPTADEIAAGVGLALYLEQLGKHTTAIYSGGTPDILRFLKPEETYEASTDGLQDFIIALNKDKADHLRYKLDGDFVKVYITPYRTRIGEEDLEFSYGDYNVDLIIALNVPTPSDLDAALSEHGRILHDAGTIDITTGEPGRFGEIEWSEPGRSSVSEMVADLLLGAKGEKMGKETATALLAGIVAATNRFSNENTTANTLAIGSKLMELGADQQLVAINVMENAPVELRGAVEVTDNEQEEQGEDPTQLTVRHNEQKESEPEVSSAEIANAAAGAMAAANLGATDGAAPMATTVESSGAGIESVGVSDVASSSMGTGNVIAPVSAPPDYAKMMEDALKEPLVGLGMNGETGVTNGGDVNPTTSVVGATALNEAPENSQAQYLGASGVGNANDEAALKDAGVPGEGSYLIGGGATDTVQPEGGAAPMGADASQASTGNVLPMPGDETLPPPVMPAVDFGAMPTDGAVEMPPLAMGGTDGTQIMNNGGGSVNAVAATSTATQAPAPDAFRIPGAPAA